jgi:hypothetical protein
MKLSVQKQYVCKKTPFPSKQIIPLVQILIDIKYILKTPIIASEKYQNKLTNVTVHNLPFQSERKNPAHGRLCAPAWAGGPKTDRRAAKAARARRPPGPKVGPAAAGGRG